MKTARDIFLCLTALLCLVAGARSQEATIAPTTAAESARRLAAEADDRAPGLEQRRDALSKLEEAARLFADAGEKSEAARALNRAGRLHLILNAPREALAAHSRALSLLEGAAGAEAETVDGLNGLAAAHIHLKEKKEAAEALRESLTLGASAGYVRGRAEALVTLSDLQNRDDHLTALKTAREALALWAEVGDREGLARAHSQTARCLLAQNTLAEAEGHYRTALQIWRESNNRAEQAEAVIMLGIVEFRKGEWGASISLLTEAQGLVDERADPKNMGRIAATLADNFNENGLPEIGLPHYERALEFYRRSQDENLIYYATWGLGYTLYLKRSYAEALAHFRRMLEGVGAESLDAAPLHDYIGRVQLETGEHDDALRNFQTALAIYARAGNVMEAARARAFAGRAFERRGQTESARRSYREALDSFVKLSDQLNEAAVLHALGRLELAGGDLRAAQDYLGRAIGITEGIRRVPASTDLTAAFSANVHERYESYVECLMRMHAAEPSRGFDRTAFVTSEQARARALAELLRATATNLLPGLDPELAAREKSLRQALRAKENYKVRLLSGPYSSKQLEALEEELSLLESEYSEANRSISESHPAHLRLTRPRAWDAQRIREEVVADERTVLLEYHLGEEKSYVWAVTRDRLTSHELPARALINAAAGRVYKALASAPGAQTVGELNGAAEELSRMILSPVAERLGGASAVIVAADGALNYVPFQLLPSPAAGGEPLVAHSEVVNVPSASVLGELREETARRRVPWKTLAAFGDPAFPSDSAQSTGGGQLAAARTPEGGQSAARDIEPGADSFDPARVRRLFYAGRELEALREVASGGETLVASGYDATRERLRATDLEGFAILHFATHGFLDPSRPEKSGLVLSTVDREGRPLEGFVGLQDVYNLRAPVDLVVLSACRTALGKEVRGEGLIGLTRGFMYAGASSVVASLWEVNDEATAELMKRFYANVLRRGMTPSAALRDAQNSIRREPQWSSPHYWAAFTLQGEYRRTIAPQGVSTVKGKALWAGGALLAACGAAAWLYLRRRRRASHA